MIAVIMPLYKSVFGLLIAAKGRLDIVPIQVIVVLAL